MSKAICIGIIGCGHWGPNFIRNFSHPPDVRVSLVCDTDSRKLAYAAGAAKKAGHVVRTETNYKKIFADPAIDAIVIATPASSHYQLAREALMSDRHVLVEKPLALEINQARILADLAHRRHRVLMVGHTFLYNPGVRMLKKLVSNRKEFGRIYYLHARRTNLGPVRKDVSAMWDLACHDISIFSYLLEMIPEKVIARGEDYLQHNREDVAFITLIYPHKIIANIHVSWLDPRKVREVTIVGSRKMLVFDDLNTQEPVRVYDKRVMKKKYSHDYASFEEFQMIVHDGKATIPRVKSAEPLAVECQDFLSSIRRNRQPISGAESGIEVLRTLEAAQRSFASGGHPQRVR